MQWETFSIEFERPVKIVAAIVAILALGLMLWRIFR